MTALFLLAMCALAANGGLSDSVKPGSAPTKTLEWNGVIKAAIPGEQKQAYQAFIPDVSKPVRAALIMNNLGLFPGGTHWRALAEKFNCIMINFPVLQPPYTTPSDSKRAVGTIDYRFANGGAQRILAALAQASRDLPGHPEIQYAPVCLYGFSVGSAAANRAAAQPEIANRVLAVVALHEIDFQPFLPPPWVPHLFLSSEGTDNCSPLLTVLDYEDDSVSTTTHDTWARAQARNEGALLTVGADVGHRHGGDPDHPIIHQWLEEVFKQAPSRRTAHRQTGGAP
ncbi:MAG: hypothetical protein PHC88_10375 [Terrimicrobiaceae bacterium]|nr:hypothetical protein [Terrimicrobiaceae bacterium]